MPNHLVLFDGMCGLCDGFVNFLLQNDHKQLFKFASLQSNLGKQLLQEHRANVNMPELDTLYIFVNYGEKTEHIKYKSSAVLFAASKLGGIWSFISVLNIFPKFILDWGYDIVATNRYKWFGHYEKCLTPSTQFKSRFLS